MGSPTFQFFKTRTMKKCFLLPSLFLIVNICFSQVSEVLFGNDDNPRPNCAAVLKDGNVLFASYERDQSSTSSLTFNKNKIFLLDSSLNKIDSINIDQEWNMDNSYSAYMTNYQDSLAILGVASSDLNFQSTNDILILLLNSQLEIKDSLRIINESRLNPSLANFRILGNKLWMNLSEFDNGILHPWVVVIDMLNMKVLKDTLYKDLNNPGRNIFSGVLKINDSYYLGNGDVTSSNQFYKINSNYNLTAEVSRKSITIFGESSHSIGTDLLIKGTNNSIYFAGTYNAEYLILGKTDSSFSHFHLDTFGIDCVPHDVFPNLACFSTTNWELFGFNDYRTLDSIYLMTGQGEYSLSNLEYRIENDMRVQSDIFVYNVDTSGQVNWRKEIAQDSVYFHPWELVATPDGGALVFSSKYDPRYKKEYHLRISIIKIDRFGNIVGEQEFAAPRAQWSVYPNPAKGKVHITGLPDAHLRKKVVLMDLSGKTVLEQEYKSGEDLQLPAALQGTYLLQVQNENGRRLGVRKIVVE